MNAWDNATVTTFTITVTQEECNNLYLLWQSYCKRTRQIIQFDEFVEQFIRECIGEIVV
jgi:hypothetical protein